MSSFSKDYFNFSFIKFNFLIELFEKPCISSLRLPILNYWIKKIHSDNCIFKPFSFCNIKLLIKSFIKINANILCKFLYLQVFDCINILFVSIIKLLNKLIYSHWFFYFCHCHINVLIHLLILLFQTI